MFNRKEFLRAATCCLAAVSVMVCLAANAQAGTVIDYDASNGLPGSEWSLSSSGTCTGAMVDDSGTAALYVVDPISTSGVWSYRWDSALTTEQVQEATGVGFSLSMTLRAEDMTADGYDETPALAPGIQIALSDLGVWYLLSLGQDTDGDTTYAFKAWLGSTWTATKTGTLSGDGYHTYEILYSSEAGSADLLIDGNEVASDLTSNSALANRIRWGAEDTPGVGAGYWTNVSFETAPASLSQVPEPSTIMLLVMAAGSLLVWKRIG